MLRVLKDNESALPIARYCSRPAVRAAAPVPPMSPEQAILPDDMNIILDQDACPKASGYCMLDNGGGYLTVKAALPGVTKEMLQWMVAWQGLEPVHYMAINGEVHHSAAVSDLDREKIGRSFLSVEEKSEGIIVYTVDQIGGELYDDLTYYLSPADQGLSLDRYVRSGAVTIGGTVLRQRHSETDPQKKSLNIMVSVVRDTADGVEVQTHLWAGYKILRREAKRFDVNGIQPTEESMAVLANYIADEWAQIGHVLPELYREVHATA